MRRRREEPSASANASTVVAPGTVKKIEAIVRHYKLDEVQRALQNVGVTGMTLDDIRGRGMVKRRNWPVGMEGEDLFAKARLTVVVESSQVQAAVEAITNAARTGNEGDGKVFVTDLEEVIRISTGESGAAAIR